MKLNKRGVLPVVVGLVLFAKVIGVTAIFCWASKRHHQQRIEKQATAEGRAEYPMK